MAETPLSHESGDGLSEAWLSGTCKVLGLDPPEFGSNLDLAFRVQRGLRTESVESLLAHGIPEAELFRSIISRRTFRRRKIEDRKLTAEESDRTERFARTLALAILVLGDQERAVRWLMRNKRSLNGQTPLTMLASGGGTRAVEELLLQGYFGLVA
jgi:putative toxin-antitoxin system antitoxin component (TIGR02293 family)